MCFVEGKENELKKNNNSGVENHKTLFRFIFCSADEDGNSTQNIPKKKERKTQISVVLKMSTD